MEALRGTVVVISMLLLRLGIPLLISLGIGYWLVRMDNRWRAAGAGQKCWDLKKCSPEQRVHCTAYQHPDIPCWAIVRATEGQLRPQCANCAAFTPRLAA
ncbi:MAG: hypothetical protein IT330_00515 [Anaerolineae bacterium]|nr:hypothetical protein [Anaerolineae bacterium]